MHSTAYVVVAGIVAWQFVEVKSQDLGLEDPFGEAFGTEDPFGTGDDSDSVQDLGLGDSFGDMGALGTGDPDGTGDDSDSVQADDDDIEYETNLEGSGIPDSTCADESVETCKLWESRGQCKYSDYVRQRCKKTCGQCDLVPCYDSSECATNEVCDLGDLDSEGRGVCTAEYLLVREGSRIYGSCPGFLRPGSTDNDEPNNVDKCVARVIAEPLCSNTFFYAPTMGWCVCEKNAGSCNRSTSSRYNEYQITNDPCGTNPCGVNAVCTAVGVTRTCSCRTGLSGDPQVKCVHPCTGKSSVNDGLCYGKDKGTCESVSNFCKWTD